MATYGENGRRRPVLVVEDDEAIREAIVELLTLEGYPVLAVEHGRAALDLLLGKGDGEAPCLILLDLMMPVMDGWDFLAARDQDPAIARIPVCVLSAVTDPRRQPVAELLLRKPLESTALLSVVARHCPA